MHKAPSVTYPVGPCFWYGRLLCLGLLVVACGGLWSVQSGQMPSAGRLAVGLGLWLMAVAAVALHLSRIQPGLLTWRIESEGLGSGEWLWRPDSGRAVLVSVRVVWAGLNTVGLRLLDGRGQVHWVWAQAQRAPEDWLAFRRALISSAASD
jgi:hypothetical protein